MVFQTFNLLQGFSARENVLAALLMSDVPKGEWQPRAETLLAHLDRYLIREKVELAATGPEDFALVNVESGGAPLRAYGPSAGLCLEPQGLPDAPNQPHFPRAVFEPGEVVHGRMAYRFSAASSTAVAEQVSFL
jgi:hypothetical protein